MRGVHCGGWLSGNGQGWARGKFGLTRTAHANRFLSGGRMIQLRNVPEVLHRSLQVRATSAGMPLSDYLIGELKEIAERPTLAEFRERLHGRMPVAAALDTARLLHEERAAR